MWVVGRDRLGFIAGGRDVYRRRQCHLALGLGCRIGDPDWHPLAYAYRFWFCVSWDWLPPVYLLETRLWEPGLVDSARWTGRTRAVRIAWRGWFGCEWHVIPYPSP